MPPSTTLTPLQSTWTTLYTQTLPSLARTKAPSQRHWPVHLDHCFARIILDAVVGVPTPPFPATPWTSKLKSPAVKNMSAQQLEKCIALGEGIKSGRANLVELDQQSLHVRGKKTTGAGKRKMVDADERKGVETKKAKTVKKESHADGKTQPSIFTAMGLPTPPTSHVALLVIILDF